MLYKADTHLHTSRSDGEADVFTMGREAFERGFVLLGFSDHAYTEHEDGSCGFGIRGEELDAYINDVYTLRDMYPGRMNVLCGLEMENISGFDFIDEFQDSQLDYLIGSTHNMIKDGTVFAVDYSREAFLDAAEKLYGGDCYALVRDYYELESRVVENTRCDIIGHVDLVTKFNEGNRLFDETSPAYRNAALSCIDVLAEAGIPFEINTGAISRGYRTEPYPSRWLLEELHRRGARITLNSDAHDPYFIGYRFDECLKLAWDCGFRKISAITPDGEREFDISQ